MGTWSVGQLSNVAFAFKRFLTTVAWGVTGSSTLLSFPLIP